MTDKIPARWTLLVLMLLGTALRGEMVTRRWGTPPKGPAAKAVRTPRAAPPTGYVVRAPKAPAIDGKLDDEVWSAATVLRLERTLDGGGPAAQPTEVRLLHDDKTLYLAVRCTEPQLDKIRASRKGHDGDVWSDDSIEFFLGLGGVYYHFGVNAVGSTYDAQAKDGSWNCGFKAAAGRGPREWTLEAAVPLTKIAGEGKLPEKWTASFNRNRYTTGNLQEAAWSPTYSGDSHVPERFGQLLFKSPPPEKPAQESTEPLVKKKSLQVLPCQGGEGVAVFDLSGLPKGAKVYRADLLVFRATAVSGMDEDALVNIEIYPLFSPFTTGGTPRPQGKPLELRSPWFDRFDATEAVQQWAAGKTNGGFFVKALPAWDAEATCLDVWYEGKAENLPPQAKDLSALHRAGQTFLTWREIEDPVGKDDVRWGELRMIQSSLDRERRVRYCVYRSEKPITAKTLTEAELIATVAPLSGWNLNARNIARPIDQVIATQDVLMTGQWNPFGSATVDGDFGRDCPIERFVIRDGDKPLPPQTGLYVHTPGKAAKAYYAVVTSVDGVQNTIEITPDNSLAEPLAETEGSGEPVLQGTLPPGPIFHYDDQRLHYVRWVAPPYGNLPSQYYNWSVAIPRKLAAALRGAAGQAAPSQGPVPLELNLHRDGDSYYRTHYRIERDSIVLCPHDFPLRTWWYGYHECQGTLKSFRQGRIHNYTERRLLAFIDWAARKWPVNRNRVLVTGCRGGASGSGALHLGLRHPEVFSLVISGHGLPNYEPLTQDTGRNTAWMGREMQALWGRLEWRLEADAKDVWEEHNLTKMVASLPPQAELPLLTMTSNHGDANCREFYRVMLEDHRPIMAEFAWGGARYVPISNTGTYPNVIRLYVARDRSLLAMTSPEGLKFATEGGMGSFNRQFRWKDVSDRPESYAVTIFTSGGGDSAGDVVPRQLQQFKAVKGKAYAWKNLSLDETKEIQSGQATAEADGVIVLPGVKFSAEGSRLIVAPKGGE